MEHALFALYTPPAGFLARERGAIVADATRYLAQVRHYDSAGPEELRRRLDVLFDRLLEAIETHDSSGILVYARSLAQERFADAYDLTDVQAAFNALEQAVWKRVFAQLEPVEHGETLRVVSATLGAAKDALAREYVSLATRRRLASIDLRALVSGCARP